MRRFLAAAALTGALLLALPAAAEEPQREMSPEEQMMMEKWQAYMTPGAPHQRLASQAGTWDYTMRLWQQPGAPPEESTGTARMESVMDGRYLVQHASGPMMGQTFNGMGVTGYDNIKQKFQSTWLDNMGTGIMMSEGTCDGRVCTFHGEAPDIMQGKHKRVRSVSREISADETVFEMYDVGPDGKEWKNFELVYRRRK